MPATGLLALLDDITVILDDVAVLSKVAAKKTAGLAGDDLAVNAEGLVGLRPARELPIVGKVALGSLANKFILVPLALVLPASVITPVLMLGGSYLCYEGVHKLIHKKGDDDEHHQKMVEAVKESPEALAEVESKKIKQAILTDFILSAEIVAVALSTVRDQPLGPRAMVLSIIALGMTALIYGFVAVIVKVDDIGLHMQERSPDGSLQDRVGQGMVSAMPYFMKGLSWLGTLAMFLVGGGILLHGIHALEEQIHHTIAALTAAPLVVTALNLLATLIMGMIVGGVLLAAVEGVKKVVGLVRPGSSPAAP